MNTIKLPLTSCGCFNVVLEAESALCCHTGDLNYKRHFSCHQVVTGVNCYLSK